MSEQKTLWMDDLDKENLRKSEEVGEILPKLNVPNIPEGEEKGSLVKVEFLDDQPKEIHSDKFQYGNIGFVISVKNLKDEVKNSLWLPKSLRFKLAGIFKKNGTLKGVQVAIWKVKADIKNYPNSTVYDCQLL